MHNITIIGSGFAGLTAARTIRRMDKTAKITLVSPRREFVFYPSLIWVPAGLRRAEDVVIDLERFCARKNINFVAGAATGLSDDARCVATTAGEIANDGLIIASGGKFIKKLPGVEHVITPCEGVAVAEAIRDRLAAMDGGAIACGFSGNPEEPPAMRGGPIFEFVFGIDTQLRREGRRDKFHLVFFTPAPEPGKRLGQKAVDQLLGQMKSRGIETRLGQKIVRFTDRSVETQGGAFDADLTIFMPGMTDTTTQLYQKSKTKIEAMRARFRRGDYSRDDPFEGKGVLAVLRVTPPSDGEIYEPSISWNVNTPWRNTRYNRYYEGDTPSESRPNLRLKGIPGSGSGLLSITINMKVADALFDGTGYTLEELQKKIDSTEKPFSFELKNKAVSIIQKVKTEVVNCKNVIGYVEGSDPKLKEELVVVGGHLDHLGKRSGMIFNGADDDGSGCVGVAELAEAVKSFA